ncbi:MAG: DUF5615 family PIN-like protein [Thermoleophilia bacterium]|nr:DUF5615 family PIN-like protein [Thermoleophilia bacterium]
MKLLFDANLSPRLVSRLSELFPGSAHVFDTGLARLTSDESIWKYAKAHGFIIVAADSDFLDLAERYGSPIRGRAARKVRLQNGPRGEPPPAECRPDRGAGTILSLHPHHRERSLSQLVRPPERARARPPIPGWLKIAGP